MKKDILDIAAELLEKESGKDFSGWRDVPMEEVLAWYREELARLGGPSGDDLSGLMDLMDDLTESDGSKAFFALPARLRCELAIALGEKNNPELAQEKHERAATAAARRRR